MGNTKEKPSLSLQSTREKSLVAQTPILRKHVPRKGGILGMESTETYRKRIRNLKETLEQDFYNWLRTSGSAVVDKDKPLSSRADEFIKAFIEFLIPNLDGESAKGSSMFNPGSWMSNYVSRYYKKNKKYMYRDKAKNAQVRKQNIIDLFDKWMTGPKIIPVNMFPRDPVNYKLIEECMKCVDKAKNDAGAIEVIRNKFDYSYFSLQEYEYKKRVKLAKYFLYEDDAGEVGDIINDDVVLTMSLKEKGKDKLTSQEYNDDISKIIGDDDRSLYPIDVFVNQADKQTDSNWFTHFLNTNVLARDLRSDIKKVISHTKFNAYYHNCIVDKRVKDIIDDSKKHLVLDILGKIFENLNTKVDYDDILENKQASVSENELNAAVDKAELVAKKLVDEHTKPLIDGLQKLFDSCIKNEHFRKLNNGNQFIRDAMNEDSKYIKDLNDLLQNKLVRFQMGDTVSYGGTLYLVETCKDNDTYDLCEMTANPKTQKNVHKSQLKLESSKSGKIVDRAKALLSKRNRSPGALVNVISTRYPAPVTLVGLIGKKFAEVNINGTSDYIPTDTILEVRYVSQEDQQLEAERKKIKAASLSVNGLMTDKLSRHESGYFGHPGNVIIQTPSSTETQKVTAEPMKQEQVPTAAPTEPLLTATPATAEESTAKASGGLLVQTKSTRPKSYVFTKKSLKPKGGMRKQRIETNKFMRPKTCKALANKHVQKTQHKKKIGLKSHKLTTKPLRTASATKSTLDR